jgi:hypothetical protein
VLHGAWTAQAARELSAKLDSLGFDVLCAHRDRRVRKDEPSHVRFGQTISWLGSDFKSSSRLAFPDIAVVDRASKKAILVAEVEESKAQPKLVIADLLATLLGDHITFGSNHKEELQIGPWTTYSILAKFPGRGSSEQQLQGLSARLNEVKNSLHSPNASVGLINIQTYRTEEELRRKLFTQAEKALVTLRSTQPLF